LIVTLPADWSFCVLVDLVLLLGWCVLWVMLCL